MFGKLFEAIEVIKLMRSLLPIAIYILNFAIAGMVASGRVSPICQNDVTNAFIDVGGYILLFTTSAVSLFHAVRKPTPTTITKPVVPQAATPTPPAVPVFTPNFSPTSALPPGTPLS